MDEDVDVGSGKIKRSPAKPEKSSFSHQTPEVTVTCANVTDDVTKVEVGTMHDEGALPVGSQLLVESEPMEENLGDTGGSGPELNTPENSDESSSF